MTEHEIKNYNRLCAEFLGLIALNKPKGAFTTINGKDIPDSFLQVVYSEMKGESWYIHPKFHSDWNWIMEVVEAIEKLKYVFRINTSLTISEKWTSHIIVIQKYSQIINGNSIIEYKSDYSNNESKKEAVVEAINQFLIWYNKNYKRLQNY